MKIKYFNFLMAILLLFGFSISSAMAEECTGPGGGTGGVGQPGRWVTIAADSNPNDSRTGYGRVTYEYSMLERPVTVAEYVTFLNAVDPDGNGNFEGALVQYELVGYSGGQWRTLAYTGCNPSVAQSFTAAQTGEMLISLVSMNQAARYANWVATGNINQGAYRFDSTSANAGNSNIISIDSTYQGIRLPNENEYYKAAYWDPIARVYNRYGTTSLDGSGDAITGAPGSTGIISSTKHPFPFDYGTDGRGNCMVYVRSGQGGRSAYGISNLVGGFHDMMHPNNFGTGNMVLRPDNQFSNSGVSGTGDGAGDFPYEHQRSTWRWDGVPIDTFYSSPSFRLVQSPSACSFGSLKVTKAVTGKPTGFSSPNFPITVNCGGSVQSFNLLDGGSKTISNILEGTSCTVTEGTLPTPPTGYVYGTPVITPSTVTIVGTTTSTVAITNPLQAACSINSFTITPACNNNGTAGDPTDDYRTFAMNLTGTGVAATYNVSANSGGTVTPTSGSYGAATNFRLQNASAGNGITYTVTATDATKSSCTRSATVSDTGSCSPTGTLQVRKVVNNKPAGFTSPNFTMQVDCSVNSFDQTFTLADGASRNITGIPTGTTCSVTEVSPLPGAPVGYEYGTPTVAPSGVQTIGNGTTVTVTVTNPLNAVSCPIISVTPNPLANGTVGVAYSASPTASANSGGPYTYTWSAAGLPAGLTVNSSTGAVSGTPSATATATVTASTTVAGQTCSGTTPLTVNPAPIGSLRVSKTVTGKPTGFSSPNFSIQVACSVSSFNQTLTLVDGGSQTITGIPTGTTCTVTEATLPAAPVGYNYGTPSIAPSGAQTIGNGTTVTVAVTNPLTLKLGSLQVGKVVSGQPAGFSSPDYTLNVDCSDNSFDQNVVVKAGQNQIISNIPHGTTCTVTEPSQPAPPVGYAYGTAVITPSAPVTIVGESSVTVTVTNPLNAVNCPVITVTPNPLANGTVGVAYSASPSASASSGGPYTYAWSATGLPVGLTVNSSTGAVSGTPSATGNATVTASTTVAGQTCSGTTPLTVNPAPIGSLRVSKTVTGKPTGFSSPNFSIQVACSVSSFNQTLTLVDGGSQTITGIPTGTTCTVTEAALPAAPVGYNYGTPSIAPSGAQTIGNGTTVSVVVTNPLTLKLGSLQVEKVVSGQPAGFSSPDYTLSVACSDSSFNQDVVVKAGQNKVISNIPHGTTCTVTEPSQPAPPVGYAYGTAVITPSAPITIVGESSVTVTVTNPLNAVNCPAITVTPNPLVNGTVGVAYSASPTASANSGGPYTYTWSATGLPAGLAVNSSTGAVSGTPSAIGSATITASTTVAGQTCAGTTPLTVNAAPTGSLQVSKSVTGSPVGFSSPSFSIQVACSVRGFNQTLTLVDGGSQTITGIPTGTTCTVTEPSPLPAAPAGYDYAAPVITPSGVQTIGNGTTVSVAVTNPLTLKLGSLQLSKSVSGQPAGFTSPDYTLHLACSDNSFDQDVLIKVDENKTISNIPHGTTCTVTEPTQPAPPAGYSYGTAVIAPASVTIVGDSSVSVSVLNPLQGDCAINTPTVTTQCYSNGTSSAADDTFGFRINTSGTFVATTYDIQAGTLAVQDVPYGVEAGTYGNFLISGGAVNATLTDSNKATCQLNNVALTPPAPCSAPPPACVTITNKAKVSALTGTDQNLGNDEDGASLGANCATPVQIDLELVKTASVNTIKRGDTLVYTLTLVNKGPDDASTVQVKDLLPAGLTYVSSQAERGSYDATSGIWTIGKAAKGVPVKLNITVRAD